MRRNSFVALSILAIVAIAAAYLAIKNREHVPQTTGQRELLYPDLTARINDVTRVLIRSPGSTVTLERQGDHWVMPERGNYPVDFAKVRSLLVQISGLETVERRTAKPELYSKLGVEDIDSPDAKSVQVTLQAKDDTLADLLVGRTRPVTEGGGVFARDASEEQAWLAKGELRPDKEFVLWLDRNIVNVDQRRIKSVTIEHADGDRVAIAKPQPAAGDYVLESPVPAGREAKPANELSGLATIPDYLTLDDVRPAAEVKGDKPAVTGSFRTYDGMLLTLEASDADGKTWVHVKASSIPPAPELKPYVEANKGKETADGRQAGQFKTEEEVTKEIEAINARTADWAYRLTDYKTGKLKSGSNDVTQEKKEPEKPAEAAPAASPPVAAAPAKPDTTASDAPMAEPTTAEPAAKQAGPDSAGQPKVN